MLFGNLRQHITSPCRIILNGRVSWLKTRYDGRFDWYEVVEVRADLTDDDELCITVVLAEVANVGEPAFEFNAIHQSALRTTNINNNIRAVDNTVE